MKRPREYMLLTLLTVAQAAAQVELTDRSRAATNVFSDVLSYATSDSGKSRIDVYVQVPYDEVRFVRSDDGFVATYDVAVIILTPEQEQVWNRVQTIEVRVKDFAQTVSNRQSSLKQMSFDVVPGKYDVRIEVRDPETRKSTTSRRKVSVPDFGATPLTISDVMLVSRLTTNGEKRSIVPNISGNIGENSEGFFIFYELYARAELEPVRFIATVVDAKGDSVMGVDRAETPTSSLHQVFMKFPESKLAVGTYTINVRASAVATKDGTSAATSRTFSVRWSDIPFSVTEIDKAIEQMRYIARENDIEHIRQGTTLEERRMRFLAYWLKRDPDPQTQRNELMEEYYQRVEYTNRTFGHYLEGWRTDRGMVYIRFGAPENVERHPFETNSRPYEVWRYYNLNYEFVFVDDTGFGDYRLRYPSTDLFGRDRPDN